MTKTVKVINHHWKVHTVGLLKEILENATPEGVGIFKIPINLFKDILAEVAQRASELNDPKLNALMCRLALYEVSDPESPEYDGDLVYKTIEEAEATK